jgi:hypothetical protein
MPAATPFDRLMSRRSWLLGSTLAGASASGLAQLLAQETSPKGPKKSCLVLWMAGGPSQTDTFDMKPGHENGGPFKPIDTSAPGIQICEHLPETARWMHKMAVVRSMSTREGDHGRATEDLRTGYKPQGPIQFPVLGSIVSNECGLQTGDLPNYISILSRGLFRAGIPPAGFLGTEFAPLIVGNGSEGAGRRLTVENLALAKGVTEGQSQERVDLLRTMESGFLNSRPGIAAEGHRTAYARAMRLMSTQAAEAFDLDRETAETHARYGDSMFSQGCLLARRLLERKVPFVEVSLGGWDTHYDNFDSVQRLCGTLDKPWAALMQDLQDRGLLESTVIVWMGEFGRTPVINPQGGRDHYPKAWTALIGGGGVTGGAVIGKSSTDGLTAEDRPVSTPDFLATICTALGLDPRKQNLSNVGRPIRLTDPSAKPIEGLVTG